MSDQSQGPGWWVASDGKWYPPETHPDYRPPPPPPPSAPTPVSGWGAAPSEKPGPPPPDPSPFRNWSDASKATPPSQQQRTGCMTVIVVALVLLFLFAVFGGDEDGNDGPSASDRPSADELEFGAFDVCKKFVSDRLRAPATAKFRNYFENDGEVSVTRSGSEFTVISTVDSQNGFGALIRSSFVCIVRHTTGNNYRLVDIAIT